MALNRLACLVAPWLAVTTVTPLSAQRTAPAHWQWALDSAAEHVNLSDQVPPGTFGFVTMAPGWHVTMGPGGLLYDSRETVEGRFVLECRLFLFPGSTMAEYGVFVGGRNLEDGDGSWAALVVRRDGSAAVLRRQSGRIETVLPWTPHPAIRGGQRGGANVIRVVADSNIAFQVNDSTIATLPRDRVPTDGRFGFRVGRDLNLHVTTLDLTRRLAPVP